MGWWGPEPRRLQFNKAVPHLVQQPEFHHWSSLAPEASRPVPRDRCRSHIIRDIPDIPSSDALFFFCPQSFPASGIFLTSWLFTSDDQNTRVSTSASVLPTSIQGWFPLRSTGLMSLLSKGLSGVFSSTIVRRHQFFGTLPSLLSNSHNRMWSLGRP